MLIAITMVAATVVVTRTDYTVYSTATQFIKFLLGPATIALGHPSGAKRSAREGESCGRRTGGVGLRDIDDQRHWSV
ncbi:MULTISPECIES: LrgB family protein [unclassified Bradyrhizobium]|uniref:LrgB family protein n=1 Tax=unclassified Bradyrhizobium TaxID=2631580 RepID=UPI0033959D72